MTNQKSQPEVDISAAIRNACRHNFGVLDSNFLCQSVGTLNLSDAVTVSETEKVARVVEKLKDNRIGCAVVQNAEEKLIGIFTERDFLFKVFNSGVDLEKASVAEYMTREPVAVAPDVTIAYALNLMSHGGFRHLPIVDSSFTAVSVISIKDVVDHIVETFTRDLLDFETGL